MQVRRRIKMGTGHKIVDEISQYKYSGNVVVNTWFDHIKKPPTKKGKIITDLLAINILADLIWWYRAEEIRDTDTGRTIGVKKKFKSDMYQKWYAAWANKFGVSKAQVKTAVDNLIRLNLIKRDIRDITFETGERKVGVTYFEPIPETIKYINQPTSDKVRPLHEKYPPYKNLGGVTQKNIGGHEKIYTLTDIPTDIPTENYSKRNSQEFLHISNSSAIENKEEDSNSGFAMRIPSSNSSNEDKENLLNYFNKNTHEYKLINNFFDSEFQAARRAAADKLNAGDIKKFQRMKNRLKHEPGELNAAENIYKILPEDIRHKIDLYIEREHKTWDKSTIKDHNSWRLTRIFEYLKCAPHVFHWTKLSQDQKEEYISKCQKEIAQYKSRNKKSKKRANSASFKQAFGTA